MATLNQIEENVSCLPEEETGICALEFLSYLLLLARHEHMPLGIWKALTQHSWDVWKPFMWNALIYFRAGNRASRLPYVLPMRFIHLMTLQNICGRCCSGTISFELAIHLLTTSMSCTKILRLRHCCLGNIFDHIGSHTKKVRCERSWILNYIIMNLVQQHAEGIG